MQRIESMLENATKTATDETQRDNYLKYADKFRTTITELRNNNKKEKKRDGID